jgi:hypothetical protein
MQSLSREYEFLVLCSKEVWGEQMYGSGVNARIKICEIERKMRESTSVNNSITSLQTPTPMTAPLDRKTEETNKFG